jgi:hypothetical protein
MPEANNAEVTELFASETGGQVQSNQPNADGPAATYEVHLQAVAGDPLGDSGTNYTLRIDCIDQNDSLRNATLSVAPQAQQFDASKWVKVGDDFKTDQTFLINVPAGVEGHLFRYVATLMSDNGDITGWAESDPFILRDP